MKLPPNSASGIHHVDDLVVALGKAGVCVTKVSGGGVLEVYHLETDDAGPLVMSFPEMVGSSLVQNLMEHCGAGESSFLPHLIRLTKSRLGKHH